MPRALKLYIVSINDIIASSFHVVKFYFLRRENGKNMKNKLGTQIILARKEAGLNQTQLADMLGRTRQAFSAWENGTVVPSPRLLKKLAQVLKKPDNFFIDGLGATVEIPVFLTEELAASIHTKSKKEQVSESYLIRQILEDWADKKTV